MRICVVAPSSVAVPSLSVGLFIYYLAEELVRRRHETVLFANTRSEPPSGAVHKPVYYTVYDPNVVKMYLKEFRDCDYVLDFSTRSVAKEWQFLHGRPTVVISPRKPLTRDDCFVKYPDEVKPGVKLEDFPLSKERGNYSVFLGDVGCLGEVKKNVIAVWTQQDDVEQLIRYGIVKKAKPEVRHIFLPHRWLPVYKAVLSRARASICPYDPVQISISLALGTPVLGVEPWCDKCGSSEVADREWDYEKIRREAEKVIDVSKTANKLLSVAKTCG